MAMGSALVCNTPKPFAGFSPGLFQPWVNDTPQRTNSEGVREVSRQRFQR
jgi:hypothetical protein